MQHLAGSRVVPTRFERDHAKTQRSEKLDHLADQRFLLVNREERGLKLDQRKPPEHVEATLENFNPITLDVDFEIGRFTGTDDLGENRWRF